MATKEIIKDIEVLSWEELLAKYSKLKEHQEIFNSLSKKELDSIRKNWGFKGLSSLKKGDLSRELLLSIIFKTDEYIEGVLGYELIKGDYNSNYLRKKGIIVNSDNRFVLDYISQMVRNDEKQKVLELSRGLLQYYGFIEIRELKILLQKYDVAISQKELESLLKEYSILDDSVELLKKTFKLKECMIDEDTIRRMSKDKDYYMPDLKIVLDHGVNKTFEINNRELFDKIFDSIEELSNDKEEILEKAFIDLNNGRKIVEITSSIVEKYSIDQIKYSSVINESFKEIFSRANLWELKGNSPNNMYEMLMKSIQPEIDMENEKIEIARKVEIAIKSNKKIGRNDPCPCGSGKKYKKCCL